MKKMIVLLMIFCTIFLVFSYIYENRKLNDVIKNNEDKKKDVVNITSFPEKRGVFV